MNVQIDVSNTVIDTPRCILRPWKEADLADFYEYASVDGVGEMAGWNHHKSIDESNAVLQSFIADKNVFALELKSNRNNLQSKRVIEKNGFVFVDQTELQVKNLGKTLLEKRYILFRNS